MPAPVWDFLKIAFGALVGGAVTRFYERKPRVIVYFGHVAAFRVLDGAVHTHQIVIFNTGRRTATNLSVPHRFLPEHVTIFPLGAPHRITRAPDGSGEIFIPALVPQEQISIAYLYFPPLLYNQIHSPIRHADGFAKEITVIPTQRLNPWRIRGFWALILIGAGTVFYGLVEVVRWVFGRLG